MYFPFYKSGINKVANNDVPTSATFSQPTDHTDIRSQVLLEAPSPKKQKLEDEHFQFAQQKFLERSEDRKSPLPYIGMIAEAIDSSPDKKMVLSEIYAYMERNFFQYLSGKPRWRNTVRHNLSFHNCFVKCECSRRGNRSHFWSIHPDYIEQFKRGNFTKTLSPPVEQTNTSSYALEQQILHRNSCESYHRFTPNSGYKNYFHYDRNTPLSTFYPVVPPPPPRNVLFPNHEAQSFSALETSPARGNFAHIPMQTPGREGNQRFFPPDPVTPPYQYRQLFSMPWQCQHAPTRVNHGVYLNSTSQTPPNTPKHSKYEELKH